MLHTYFSFQLEPVPGCLLTETAASPRHVCFR